MSASSNGGPEAPENNAVREEPPAASTSGAGSAEPRGFDSAGSIADEDRVSPADEDKPVEPRVSDDFNESTALKLHDVDIGISDASGAESRFQNRVLKKTKKKKKVKGSADYDSMLSEFDHFASRGAGEAVGYGYEIGDMVWGKVKSHPWWPGHIYNEAHASPSVQRSKRDGHVLVAFFGDSSYGWYYPAELIPFEENFAEKSRQTTSRHFLKAVEEAVDELSRRRGLGLACRCRNEFNFWPSSVKDSLVVDVGDYEPVVYSLSQINKARKDFHPNEMLSFVKELALTPMANQHWKIEFIKSKATALACRRALFEEFDETYAQAFGTVPVRPPRPTAPVAVNPSKAPLSGRLVTPEAPGKKKNSIKPTKTKDEVEKDKYIFKRRDEPVRVKTKKPSPAYPLLVDGSGLSAPSGSTNSDIKPSEGEVKKPKLLKRQAEESNSENVVKKKRKKEMKTENVSMNEKKRKKEAKTEAVISNSNSGEVVEKVPEMPLDIPLSDQKNDDSEGKLAIDVDKEELPILLKDLRALAINPFHGVERNCPEKIPPLFLKYRSLVYQKSLVLLPSSEIEKSEPNFTKPPPTEKKTSEKSAMKLKRTLIRPTDPTVGGRKRGPLTHPDAIKKKRKLDDSDDTNKKKEEIKLIKKKKIPEESKPLSTKPPQKPNEPPKEIRAKNFIPKPESGKRMQQPIRLPDPTMLVMKFPPGASLPSGAQLRAKFARFGPLDHSATRVFWETYTCRLVYKRKPDAEAAVEFAVGSDNLFGCKNVRCYIREVRDKTAAAAESEAAKIQKEEIPARVVVSTQPRQHHLQLKSCLKKQSGEEGGNGSGRGTRVKFLLGGEAEQISSYTATTTTATHSSSSKDVGNSKDLPKFKPELQKLPLNTPAGVELLPTPSPKNDISQELLKLLIRCRDVVKNLTGEFGYVPYHSL